MPHMAKATMISPHLLFPVLLLLLSSLTYAHCNPNSFTPSRAVYNTSANPRGACGYFDYGATVNGGNVAAVGRLYRNGTGCGACYQLRCTDEQLCDASGLRVVVTDNGRSGSGVDFILSSQAFGGLAKPEFKNQLLASGVVGVEYRRISCEYPGHNLVVKVMHHSIYPNYLAITFYYQGGPYDIIDVQVSRWCRKWLPMRHAYGAVWDLASPLMGLLNVRFLAAADAGSQKLVELENVLPMVWTPGAEYDTGIQLS